MRLHKLNEHFVTVLSDDIENRRKYVDEVRNIFEKSYADIGGTNADKDELLMPDIMWKLVRRNEKIAAAIAYKMRYGRKAFLAGSDGTTDGKRDLIKIMKEDLDIKDRGAWVEVSGAPEHIYLDKLGGVPIPNVLAKEILEADDKKVLELNSDGYHYTRNIGGKPYEKIMVGNIIYH